MELIKKDTLLIISTNKVRNKNDKTEITES